MIKKFQDCNFHVQIFKICLVVILLAKKIANGSHHVELQCPWVQLGILFSRMAKFSPSDIFEEYR